MKGRAEGAAQFVVAGGDAAELFELVEKAFDAVALAIERLVLLEFLAPRGDRRNDRFDAIGGQAFANAVRIAAFVERGGFGHVVRVEALVEAFKLAAVVGLAGRQAEGGAAVLLDRRRVDFRAPTPAKASQSLIGAVFFGARPPHADARGWWSEP